MSFQNRTEVQEFLLLAFNYIHKYRFLLLYVLIFIYMVTLVGNLLIIITSYFTVYLHSPMYFFLSNFSFSEIVFSTNIIPNLLYTILHGKAIISKTSCITQYYMYSSSTSVECLLLAVMSYDRYLAICNPLHYSSIMTIKLCLHLVTSTWFTSCMLSVAEAVQLSEMFFCDSAVIDHFFCDLGPLIQLSCSDTSTIEMTDFILCFPILVFPVVFIIISYINIISSILHISSTLGRKKAFSTCSSHLIVISTYYGTCIFIYMTPLIENAVTIKKVLSLLYIVVTPLINPFIYSLRNKDIRLSIVKLCRKVKEYRL
ncbi:olfactory receptor 1468-like [Pelobates fuscus]|uniref:olfactory receptor 1468-like n=1 Tax=Pelobates fuscus TaxID=191477 RepID=UPI002FE49D8F